MKSKLPNFNLQLVPFGHTYEAKRCEQASGYQSLILKVPTQTLLHYYVCKLCCAHDIEV